MGVGWGGENRGLRRVWEVKNYKKWVHVKPSGFAKLTSIFLTGWEQGSYLQMRLEQAILGKP